MNNNYNNRNRYSSQRNGQRGRYQAPQSSSTGKIMVIFIVVAVIIASSFMVGQLMSKKSSS
ncbi:MAG: hypothetical protein LBU60_02490, partial [Clostridiales bacterium]|nr:hypothetical protein [Clostridiales bacterium]